MNRSPLFESYPLKRLVGLLGFWGAVFILNAGPHWEKYSSTRELIETVGMITVLQMVVALIVVKLIVPRFLDQQRWVMVWVSLLLTLIIASEINIFVRVEYLEVVYPDSYKRFLELYGHMSLLERMSLMWSMRYIIFSKLPLFLFPAGLLVAYDFYQKQQLLLRVKEQKKTAELDALKNQLNPHFIFNTLNNIYSLALKKSDETPAAIEKLSAILDYVVYRCNEQFMPLESEVLLIENYVALEKIRYGDRLSFSIDNTAGQGRSIAPLILLTLLENACKHGTREELNQAKVAVSITSVDDGLEIRVVNTKPLNYHAGNSDHEKVGLANLKKQLELLYPRRHDLLIDDQLTHYTAVLRLEES